LRILSVIFYKLRFFWFDFYVIYYKHTLIASLAVIDALNAQSDAAILSETPAVSCAWMRATPICSS
jgi:hypothetical protein